MNRKRHTKFRRVLRVSPLVFFLSLVACCAVKPPPPKATLVAIAPQVAAPRQPSAVPNFTVIREKSKEADDANARTTEKIKQVKINLGDTHVALQGILLDVDVLLKKTFATENDLLEHWNNLVAHEKRFSILMEDMEKATEMLEVERVLRAEVNSRLSETEAQIRAKDAEAEHLRSQLTHEQRATQVAAEQAAGYRDEAAHNKQLHSDAVAAAAKVKGGSDLKTKFLIGLGLALIVSIIMNLLQLKGGIL